jgi:hypothetical protein
MMPGDYPRLAGLDELNVGVPEMENVMVVSSKVVSLSKIDEQLDERIYMIIHSNVLGLSVDRISRSEA